jgi:hypothetical protein
MFSLFYCWALFAVIFFLKSLFVFYLDVIGIPVLIQSSDLKLTEESVKNLYIGVNIQHFVKIFLEQFLVFAIYKTAEIFLLAIQ